MALKTGIFSLALGALLLGSTARADDTQKAQAPQNDNSKVKAQGFSGSVSVTWGDDDDRYGDDRYDNDRHDDDQYDNDRYADRGAYQGHGRRHGPQPTPPQGQQGRYELRNVQQWVPGRHEQVWVPQDCRYRPRWGRSKCTGGYYDQQWVEGHYETVQQWVWVPSRGHRGGWGTPVTYYHY